MCRTKLGVELKLDEIQRSHYVGRPRRQNQARPIIARFSSYRVRARVFQAKRQLKNSGMLITEDLTKYRAMHAYKARCLKRSGKIVDTWTSDGRIKIKVKKTTQSMCTWSGVRKTYLTRRHIVLSKNCIVRIWTEIGLSDSKEYMTI